MGTALNSAQLGGKHPAAKPLSGFGGAGVLEIVDDFDGETYRAVYTVKFANTVYVLHAFQKKSRKGIETPKNEIDLIRRRYKSAEARTKHRKLHDNCDSQGVTMMRVTKGSGNVFRDLGLPDADLLQAKADLVHRISVLVGKRGLSQVKAAEVLTVTQPKISALLHGRLEGFSMDRLVRFLIALDQDVRISVRSKKNARPIVKVA
jgi:phage-related protein/predicted XRE-type DNA-binding protein